MCVLLKYIFFDFASDATLKDRANVLRFFSALAQDGEFHLVDSDDSGSPDAFVQAWSSALQRGARNAWLRFENGSRLSLTFGLYGGDWRRWYVMVYDAAIDAPEKQDNVRSLLKSCEIVYRALQPDYGYGLVALESQLLGAPGENEPTALYDYNFFSPRLVRKIGRETLLSLPAYRIQEYEDGGILLEFSPSPLVDRKAYAPRYCEAASAIGVSTFYQGGI